jgi:peptide/nickel transport system substrate-binding protein
MSVRLGPAARICRLLLLVALAGLLCVLWSPAIAGADETSASPSAPKVVLNIGWLEDPENLNPFVGVMGTDYELWHLNYDYLVGFDNETLEPRPEFAESWSTSEDGLTWTFKIRPGMKWQDGEAATARDVAFTFNYIKDNQLTLYVPYTEGIDTVEATDDTTVVFHTSKPKSNMLSTVVPILPEHLWSKVDGEAAGSTYKMPIPIVGSGPFQVVEWKVGQFVRVVSNPDYWKGQPSVDEIIFRTYTNADTMTQDLKKGVIDGAINLRRAQFDELESESILTTNPADSFDFYHVGFNCYDSSDSLGNPVLRDEVFRQAMNWAVDRQKAVDLVLQGYGEVGSSVVPPFLRFHWEPTEAERFTFDPEKAKSMLDEAGYKDVDGDGFRETKDGEKLSLRLFANSSNQEGPALGKLVVAWFEDVGVKVEMTAMGDGPLVEAIFKYDGDTFTPDFDMYIWYWTLEIDPTIHYAAYTPLAIGNFTLTQWTDPAFVDLYDQFTVSIEDDARVDLSDQMQKMIYDACPYIVFFYPYQTEGYDSSKWTGWTHIGGEKGPVLYGYPNVDTYVNLTPQVSTVTPASSNTGLIIGIIVAAVVVIALAVWLIVRRVRRPATEE